MKIDRALNLMIPGTRADGTPYYVHSTPISAEIFDRYWEPLVAAWGRIYTGGFGILGGPRIAHKMLRKVATEQGCWEGPGGVQQGLIVEIHRLTNMLLSTERGWEMVPFEEASKKSLIDAADVDIIEGAITFFSLASVSHRSEDLPTVLSGAARLWGAQTISLSCTDYLHSLPTSTRAAPSGVKAA